MLNQNVIRDEQTAREGHRLMMDGNGKVDETNALLTQLPGLIASAIASQLGSLPALRYPAGFGAPAPTGDTAEGLL